MITRSTLIYSQVLKSSSALLIAAVLLVTLTSSAAHSQSTASSRNTLVSEGVEGVLDSDGRAPVLTVSTTVTDENVKIVADEYNRHEHYRRYPVKFEFYINRALFSTQIRSKALPGPVGVDVGPDIAVPPFNYTVVATVLVPNRRFSTVIEGAVFSNNLVNLYDCTLTVQGINDADTRVFVGNAVEPVQRDNASIALQYETESVSGDQTADVSAVVVFAGEVTSGSLTIVRNDVTQRVNTSGTAERDEQGAVTGFNLSSEDGTVQLVCS